MSAEAPRLPFSVVSSLVLHAGALAVWLHLSSAGSTRHVRAIGNVDLLIQVRRPAAAPAAQKPPPASTFDFLKMALPAMPKVAPQRLEVKVPEPKKALAPMAPKLDDRGKRLEAKRLEALDLSEKRVDAAKIEAKIETRKAAALSALPRLEEVGRRQVRNLPQALALEERRQEAATLQRLESLNVESSHRHLQPQAEALQDAAPAARSRLARKLADMLPTEEGRVELKPELRPAPEAAPKRLQGFTAAPLRRQGAEAIEERKKGVEIEGPLADRRVVSFEVPEFPEWARQQGILEASVAIRFNVSREGDVLPNMRIERTSGYGRLDRLAMESLKVWKFAPLGSDQRQWGIITFRFLLE